MMVFSFLHFYKKLWKPLFRTLLAQTVQYSSGLHNHWPCIVLIQMFFLYHRGMPLFLSDISCISLNQILARIQSLFLVCWMNSFSVLKYLQLQKQFLPLVLDYLVMCVNRVDPGLPVFCGLVFPWSCEGWQWRCCRSQADRD